MTNPSDPKDFGEPSDADLDKILAEEGFGDEADGDLTDELPEGMTEEDLMAALSEGQPEGQSEKAEGDDEDGDQPSDIPPEGDPIVALTAALDITRTEAASAKEELEEMKDRYMRTAAELENVRRRAMKEKTEAAKFGLQKFAVDLAGVADNMHRALAVVDDAVKEAADEALKNLITGIEMTERELMRTFEKHGLTRIDPEPGTRFDPAFHEAMFQADMPDQPDGTIIQVLEVGYRIEDRLIRAARVGVAKGGPKYEEAADEEAATAESEPESPEAPSEEPDQA